MCKLQSHWLVLTYHRPCFDFSESIRANAHYVINIHEPSRSFYMVINSRIRDMTNMHSYMVIIITKVLSSYNAQIECYKHKAYVCKIIIIII